MEFSLFKSWIIRRLSNFLFLMDRRTEQEYNQMVHWGVLTDAGRGGPWSLILVTVPGNEQHGFATNGGDSTYNMLNVSLWKFLGITQNSSLSAHVMFLIS